MPIFGNREYAPFCKGEKMELQLLLLKSEWLYRVYRLFSVISLHSKMMVCRNKKLTFSRFKTLCLSKTLSNHKTLIFLFCHANASCCKKTAQTRSSQLFSQTEFCLLTVAVIRKSLISVPILRHGECWENYWMFTKQFGIPLAKCCTSANPSPAVWCNGGPSPKRIPRRCNITNK